MADEQMTPEKKVDAYIALYKQQMERFGKTQEIEWKGNFGLWAFLAGAIYFISDKKEFSLPLGASVGILLAIIVIHWAWLKAVHRSQEVDKKLWVQYRGKAIRILQPEGISPEDGAVWVKRPWYRELFWLCMEVGMTVMLSGALFMIMHWRSGQVLPLR